MMLEKRRQDKRIVADLKALIQQLNTNQDDKITEDELRKLYDEPDIVDTFEMAGLTVLDVHTFFDTLCKESGSKQLDIDSFVEAAYEMKGAASALDVQTIL